MLEVMGGMRMELEEAFRRIVKRKYYLLEKKTRKI